MERDATIEGARKLCGVETAGQLGFLQPLAETFRSMNADKNIEGLHNGSSSKEYSGELSCTSPLRTQSPMMNLGQLLGLVLGHVLARPQNVLKNPCPDLF